jgi:hypothetical protein
MPGLKSKMIVFWSKKLTNFGKKSKWWQQFHNVIYNVYIYTVQVETWYCNDPMAITLLYIVY